MMLALAVALLLECKPVELQPFSAKGNTKRGLELQVSRDGMRLREGEAELWRVTDGWFKVLFAADDTWVAVRGPYPSSGLAIAPTTRGANLTVVEPLQHLSAAEKQRVPETSCGTSWFKGWKSSPNGLELEVDQGQARTLTLRVTPDGKVASLSPGGERAGVRGPSERKD